MLISYEFYSREGEPIRGSTLYTEIVEDKRQPEFPGSDIRCDLQRVEAVTTSDGHFSPRVYWRDDVFGTEGSPDILLEDRDGVPLDIALVQLREGETWIVRAEPTMNNRIGVTISNSRKPLFVGVGDLSEVEYTPLRERLSPKRGTSFTFTFSEIFSWRRGSPFSCGHTSGADRKHSPATMPDYSPPDGGVR